MKSGKVLILERLIAVLLLFLCFHVSANAREGDVSKEVGKEIVAIYSDVCWHEEAGDLLGHRVLVVNSNDDYSVVYQEAEGVFTQPHVTEATIEKGKINFSYPVHDDSGKSRLVTFSGKITPLMITGSLFYGPAGQYEKETLRLKRQPNKKTSTRVCG